MGPTIFSDYSKVMDKTLRIDNPEDQKRFDEGKLRMEHRLKEREK